MPGTLLQPLGESGSQRFQLGALGGLEPGTGPVPPRASVYLPTWPLRAQRQASREDGSAAQGASGTETFSLCHQVVLITLFQWAQIHPASVDLEKAQHPSSTFPIYQIDVLLTWRGSIGSGKEC